MVYNWYSELAFLPTNHMYNFKLLVFNLPVPLSRARKELQLVSEPKSREKQWTTLTVASLIFCHHTRLFSRLSLA